MHFSCMASVQRNVVVAEPDHSMYFMYVCLSLFCISSSAGMLCDLLNFSGNNRVKTKIMWQRETDNCGIHEFIILACRSRIADGIWSDYNAQSWLSWGAINAGRALRALGVHTKRCR